PGYSMKAHIDAARPAEKPAENHGEAIPQTGSNETAAIFAIVSAAAAAAYVVFATKTKKKEDED
ncbi:MAG: LPXTG cell wall anchor domain-containing protein, partial [Clostridia bacterium]|nr:LPXTG cell wall anchor domain-containing protein [Clostridia bacterium]